LCSVNGGAYSVNGDLCFVNGVTSSVNGGAFSVNGGANYINGVVMFECRDSRFDNSVLKFQTEASFSINCRADILKLRGLFVFWGSHT